jgi:serine/threonine-protein kinase RsbW
MAFLTIPADLSRVSDVRRMIDEAEAADMLPPDRIYDLKVVVSEACANAIEHAGSDVRVSVWQTMLWHTMPQVVVEVANVGEFKPRCGGYHDEQRRGFGLSLMFTLADEVYFKKGNHGTTTLRLSFKSSGASDEPGDPEGCPEGADLFTTSYQEV